MNKRGEKDLYFLFLFYELATTRNKEKIALVLPNSDIAFCLVNMEEKGIITFDNITKTTRRPLFHKIAAKRQEKDFGVTSLYKNNRDIAVK